MCFGRKRKGFINLPAVSAIKFSLTDQIELGIQYINLNIITQLMLPYIGHHEYDLDKVPR